MCILVFCTYTEQSVCRALDRYRIQAELLSGIDLSRRLDLVAQFKAYGEFESSQTGPPTALGKPRCVLHAHQTLDAGFAVFFIGQFTVLILSAMESDLNLIKHTRTAVTSVVNAQTALGTISHSPQFSYVCLS